MALTESKKRDFISQLVALVETKTEDFIAVGYAPENRIAQLKDDSKMAEEAEGKQMGAMAAAKDATALSKETLDTAYRNASDMVELVTGLFGKNHSLVLEIRKMRK